MATAIVAPRSGGGGVLNELSPAARAIYKYRNSCWDFFCDCVFTLDQADKEAPVKKYPAGPGFSQSEYLQYLINKIVDEHLLALVKHRRMIATWTACGICLWDAMFFEGRLNAIISKKETDSDDLVRRCKFIYENIPVDVLPVKPVFNYKFGNLYSDDLNSRIMGLAQGPDQLRQYTCSRIFADEIAFWPDARATFVAMKPTISGGGKIFLCSTRSPGFFQQVIEDSLDDQ